MTRKGENVTCEFCGIEIRKRDANYVEGRPYCEDCYKEGEIHADNGDVDDDDNDDDDDDDDDNDDDD